MGTMSIVNPYVSTTEVSWDSSAALPKCLNTFSALFHCSP